MEFQVKDPKTGWWMRVPEPRVAAVILVFAYALLSVAGLSALIEPPQSVEVAFRSDFLVLYWGSLLFLGGGVCAASVLPGWYWTERVGLLALALGLAMYGVTVFSFHNPGVDNRLPQILTLTVLLILIGSRWSRIRHDLRNPEKTSTHTPR